MKTIQVFDPANLTLAAAAAAADLAWAAEQGAKVERFSQADQAAVFDENATVRSFIDRSGPAALPLVLVDGEIAMAGRYPNRAELGLWLGVEAEPEVSGCCSGGRCAG